jgi:hypothetical protein
MAGAGYRLYATGDILTAAQVNNYLQEQTVMVFDDAAARTTALAGVVAEGMISYLKDTNSTEYYSGSAWVSIAGSSPLTTKGDLYGYSTTNARVPVGTNGQVLTADSAAATGVAWATPASSGGMTLLATSTLTGASVTVSSISQDYKHLLVLLKGVYTSAGENMCFRLNGDSGSLYSWGQIRNVTTTVSGAGAENETKVVFSNGTISASTPVSRLASATIWLYRYTDTDQQEFDAYSYADSGSIGSFNSHGQYNKSAAVDSITYFPLSGNWSGGTAYLYGVN